ncbi:MAG: CapA family protein [candidate division FCPU426 bacterium]
MRPCPGLPLLLPVIFGGLLQLVGCASVPAPLSLPAAPLSSAGTMPESTPEPTSTPAPEPTSWTLVAGGDVLPACWLDPYLEQNGQDYPYEFLSPYFQSADIGLVNLECPLSTRGRPFRNKKFTFHGKPEAASALRRAGITAVSLANNHILDFGPEALQDTLEALDAAEIAHAGAGPDLRAAHRAAAVHLAGNRTLAILSYSLTYPSEFWAGARKPGTALARFPLVEADIRSATAWADEVVVCFHWGGELEPDPKSYQIQYGHAAIDAGARIVLGSHPHILQGVEWYRGGVIFYSLGNLVFGGGRSAKAVDSILAKTQVESAGSSLSAWALALSVDNLSTRFMPRPLNGSRAERIYQHLQHLSSQWGTRFQEDDSGWVRILPPEP